MTDQSSERPIERSKLYEVVAGVVLQRGSVACLDEVTGLLRPVTNCTSPAMNGAGT